MSNVWRSGQWVDTSPHMVIQHAIDQRTIPWNICIQPDGHTWWKFNRLDSIFKETNLYHYREKNDVYRVCFVSVGNCEDPIIWAQWNCKQSLPYKLWPVMGEEGIEMGKIHFPVWGVSHNLWGPQGKWVPWLEPWDESMPLLNLIRCDRLSNNISN